jgi:SMI1 / KNR4 family (SUKH-1)
MKLGTLVQGIEMTIDDFFAAINNGNALRPESHTPHPPASAEMIEEWEKECSMTLPADFAAMLRRSNGIGLHQDWEDGETLFFEGAFYFYSLDEIRPAELLMCGKEDDDGFSSWLAIGEGPDCQMYFVFDAARRRYLSVSPIMPEKAVDLGPSIGPILQMIDPAPDFSRIRCPLCRWRPIASSLWSCEGEEHLEHFFDGCGTAWNTFNTHGLCPGCGHRWRWTACLNCDGWSPQEEWYSKESD